MQYSISMVKEVASFLNSKGFTKAKVAVVLGTGLSSLVNKIDNQIAIPYTEIPHFVTSTVEFHKGQLIFGTIKGVPVIVMQGRFHYYEGYSMQQITFPIRVFKEMNVDFLLLSNAAGGINLNYKKGDLVLLTDHINQQPENPLRGMNNAEFGNRFVDMCNPYSEKLNQIITDTAKSLSISIQNGIYVSVAGPNLETKAEYRWLRSMGADLVGMSTVPEVIVANCVGMPCAAISVITDECDPDNLKPVNIAEIIEVACKADEKLCLLITEVIINAAINSIVGQ